MGSLKPSIESSARAGLSGQSLVEFAMVLPLVLTLVFGIIEVSYALFENHLIIKLAREGANLISRGTNLGQAETSLLAATTAPVAFNAKGKLVLSVIKLGDVRCQSESADHLAAAGCGNPERQQCSGEPADFLLLRSALLHRRESEQ